MRAARWPIVAATGAVLVGIPLLDGHLLEGLDGVGYTVCHQLPERSFFMAGQQLPLCARCTGIYLGFLVGLLGLALLGRLRSSQLPPGRVVALLLLSMLAMALDGFNSLLSFLPDASLAYEPSNLLRLATGTAAGTSLALLLMPLFNDALWSKPDPFPSVADPGELVGFVVLASLAAALVYSAHPALLYPVAIASVIGVFAALSIAGATMLATLARKERQATSLFAARYLLLGGFAAACVSMAALGIGRAYFAIIPGL